MSSLTNFVDYNICHDVCSTECVTDLYKRSALIIFESILTTFEASIIFKAAGAVVEISSSQRITNFNHFKLAPTRETHSISQNLPKLPQHNMVSLTKSVILNTARGVVFSTQFPCI